MKQQRLLAGLVVVGGSVVVLFALFAALRAQGETTAPSEPVVIATATASPTGPDVVAVVDGDPISRDEWQKTAALDRVLSQLAGQVVPNAEATLERLINERLVLKRAGSPTATDADAQNRLAALRQSWGIDDATFDHTLAQVNLSRADVVDEIKRLLIVEAYLKQIAATQDPNEWLAAQRAQSQIGVYVDLAAAAAPPVPPAEPTVIPTPALIVPVGLELGQQAPDFVLNDLDDRPVQLYRLRGRPVVINFWATWCPPCRAEAPALQAAYQRYQDRVALLGVDEREDAATVLQFASEFGLTYPLLLDRNGDASMLYQVLGIPTTVILDANGVVRARHVGPLTEDQLAQVVDPLLAPVAATPIATAPPSERIAPDFSSPRETGETVRLIDYRDKSNVVLVFYRGQT